MGNTILGMTEQQKIRELLVELNLDLNEIEAQEQDVNFGYGGQERTAAYMMDSCATQGYTAYGCGMRFQYGIEQRIQDGYSIDYPDELLIGCFI